MQREEFDRLLAGYATNQLTDDETSRLMEAAMANQTLFNELADEEALRETLAAPGMKAELLRELAPEAKQSFWDWLRKPQIWALAGTAAVAALAFVFVIQPRAEKQKPAEIAQAPAPALQQPEPKVVSAPVVERERRDAVVTSAGKPAPETMRKEPLQVKKDVEPQKEVKAEQVAVAAAPPPPAPAASAPAPPRQTPARQALVLRSADEESSTMAKAKAGGAARPAMQFTVLRRNEQGEFVESAPGAVLGKGDLIRLAVTSSGRGYISLTEAGTNRQLHFGFVEPGVKYTIPTTGAMALDGAGTEKRLRLSFLTGVGNVSDQSPGAHSLREQNTANQAAVENMANSQQNASPATQSMVEIVIRYR